MEKEGSMSGEPDFIYLADPRLKFRIQMRLNELNG
jgi:hypothetical protein